MAQLSHTRHASIYALFQDNCLAARNIDEPDKQALQNSRSVADTDPRRLRLQPQLQPKARCHRKETEKGGTFSDDGSPCRTGFGWPAYFEPCVNRQPTCLPFLPQKPLPCQKWHQTARTQQQRHHGGRTRGAMLFLLSAAVQPSGATLHLPKDALVDGDERDATSRQLTCSLGSVTPRKGDSGGWVASEGGPALGKRARWPEGEGDFQCILAVFFFHVNRSRAVGLVGWLNPLLAAPGNQPTPFFEAESRHGMGSEGPAESVHMLEPTPRCGPKPTTCNSDCLREEVWYCVCNRALAKVLPLPVQIIASRSKLSCCLQSQIITPPGNYEQSVTRPAKLDRTFLEPADQPPTCGSRGSEKPGNVAEEGPTTTQGSRLALVVPAAYDSATRSARQCPKGD